MPSRRQPRLHVSAALALLTFAGCTYAVVSGGRINVEPAERIYTNVQEVRQLNFKAEVPLVLMDQAQANRVLESEVAQRYGEVELQRAAEVGALTGLYAAGTNLKAQAMRMLSSQVVGFYDPQDRQMILIKSKSRPRLWSEVTGFFTRRDATGEMLVAHELTHALQEQYFGLHSALDRITDNDDAELALKAVAEGDATLVGYGYVAGPLDAEAIGTLLTHLQDMPKLLDVQSPGTPAALRDSLIFQYSDGTRFVGEAYKRGGWNAVNALYRKPPLSTRQIIDPALYFDHHATPLTITVGGWKRTLRGWHEVAENTYGELLLRVILMRNQSDQTRAILACGWRGDRMVVLQNGGALTVIWIVALSDDTSAAAFAYDYEGILARIATGTAAPHHVERRGSAVLAIIGPGAAQSAELAPAVWRASVIGPDAPRSGG
jgi:hypothetical protein